jgi:hypothetical protein
LNVWSNCGTLKEKQQHMETIRMKPLAICRDIFIKKSKDYGTAWRIMRISSITDQLFIKAKRIRTIQEKKEQKVADSIEGEFYGIINYGIMTLIQLELGPGLLSLNSKSQLSPAQALSHYDFYSILIKEYLSTWKGRYASEQRDFSVESLVDIILEKLARTKLLDTETKSKKIEKTEIADLTTSMLAYALVSLNKIEQKE